MAKKQKKAEQVREEGTEWPYGLVLPPEEAGCSLSFGEALDRLKRGHKLAREGWNGKGMWIAYTPGLVIPIKNATGEGGMAHLIKEKLKKGEETPVYVLPRIDMRTADGFLLIGWLASQTDMLACDWVVVG